MAEVLRSRGRHEGKVRGYDAIRPYLGSLQPVLTTWAEAGVLSLREVTRQPVIPKPVPSDLVACALQQTKTPLGRLVLVLAAVHAVPVHELRTILTGDLDLARGTLVIRRGLRRHTLYLEELTHQIAADWLDYRHRRWPSSTNPRCSSARDRRSTPTILPSVRPFLRADVPPGLTLVRPAPGPHSQRSSRNSGPLQLMRLFGITEKTAMHYVTAVHPERTAKLPR
ncbi:hypothetical protein [Streptomyces griseosporeus]|uniref:hypothetical protein n=1 Tax=Streptomyces griseosporeus TaxID=1910 RepID=UPI0036FECD10